MVSIAVDLSVYENGKKAPEWTLDSDLDGVQSLEDLLKYTKASLILIADEALREEQGKGFDKKPVVTVDGRVGKPVYNVNPLGSIVFTARQDLNDILIEAYMAVQERSPVDTGKYKSSHYVFLNGQQVATDTLSLQTWINSNPEFKQGDILRILNITPYGRKLERYGITANKRATKRTVKSRDKQGRSGTGGRVLAPNGVYYLTSRQILRKYKNNSNIKFEFIPGRQIGLTQDRFKTINVKNTKTQRPQVVKRKRPGNTYLYPCIKIVVDEKGIL